MSTVVVAGVTKTYPGRPPVPALQGVDLSVERGHIVAVLGPSGCGKTTLLRTIAGFERPDSGTITFGDRVVASTTVSVPPERRRVGIVPQEGALFPHLDVAGNVGYALHSMSRSERRTRVRELLDMVGLAGLERRRPHELSGGQQQRVALARALAPNPSVVLLDEPFTALDASLRASLRADVTTVLRAAGATVLFVTHDPAEALGTADAVAIMSAGRIVQCGANRDVYFRPVDIGTARLLGEVVVVDGVADGETVTCALGVVPLPSASLGIHGAVELALRPEQVTLDDTSPIKAKLVDVTFHGHDATIALEIGTLGVAARWLGAQLPELGEVVGVSVIGSAVAVTGAGSVPAL